MFTKNQSESFDLLDHRLQSVLEELGFAPTPGQLEYLEAIIQEEDVLVVASTGSGKTFGTILACLHRILTEEFHPISTVVVTPLKALNRDIFRRVLPMLGKKLGVSIAVRHGDTPQSERNRQTKNPPQLLIMTPELFQAALPAKIFGREHLKHVRTLVIDEIHELVGTKRGVQLSLALERLVHRVGHPVQRIGLSATVGTPQDVLEFMSPNNPSGKLVQIPSSKVIQISLEYPTSSTSHDTEHLAKELHTTEEAAIRFMGLVETILSEDETVLLFTNTRQQAEVLGYRFNRYNEQIASDFSEKKIRFEVHHSSLSAESRLHAEAEVRDGKLDLIIATSSLELGIDIGSISLVIQYMSPRRIETLLQRVGRAGHQLAAISRGIIIAETPRDLMEAFFIKRLAMEGSVEPTRVLTHGSWDVLFHAIIGILLDFGEVTVKEILKIVTGANPYQHLTPTDLIPLLEYGRDNHFFYINKSDNGVISLKAKRKSYRYYYSNLSTIPSIKNFTVVDVGTRSRVGQLDEGFVSTRGEKGAVFVLNGLAWELLAIKDDRIEVRQVRATDATLPTWEGELIPVSLLVAETTYELFSDHAFLQGEPRHIRQELNRLIREHRDSNVVPSRNRIYIETAGRQMVLHTFLGSRANDTLGIVLSTVIGARQGYSVEYRTDPYSVFLSLPRPAKIRPIIEEIDPKHLRPLLEHRLKSSELFAWRLQHVARRFGAISESLQSSPMMTKLLVSRYQDTIIGIETVNEILTELLDLEVVEDFFQNIHLGTLQVEEIGVRTFDTPLSRAATQPISANILKIRPSHLILEKVEKRIRNTWVRLVCMRPGCKFEKVQRIETLKEDIQCPQCRARFVAVVHQKKTGIKGLLSRSIDKNKKLTPKEKKDLDAATRSADLILSFGKRAAFVLAGRGIGPRTAVRILRSPQKTTEDLLALMYAAEANFARTREYWD
ncbi:MAG: DEAD/DEAH box helicase [Candidatus Thorarchaeota archaeon]